MFTGVIGTLVSLRVKGGSGQLLTSTSHFTPAVAVTVAGPMVCCPTHVSGTELGPVMPRMGGVFDCHCQFFTHGLSAARTVMAPKYAHMIAVQAQ